MPDPILIVLAVVLVGGVFWVAYRLLGRAQQDDGYKRGQDSSEPGGMYTDATGYTGPD